MEHAVFHTAARRLGYVIGWGCAAFVLSHQAFAQAPPPQLPAWLQKLVPPKSADAPPAAAAQPAAQPAGPAPTIRSQDSAKALFLKVVVTGEDLRDELLAVKTATADAKAKNAMAAMVGRAAAELSRSNAKQKTKFNWKSYGSEAAKNMLTAEVIGYSSKLLSQYLDTMLGDSDALKKETIALPPQGAFFLTYEQQQSLLTVAALVVAERIANKTLAAAQKDFDNTEAEYLKLMERRQKAAGLLADILEARRQALAVGAEAKARGMEKDLSQYFSKADLAFIDSLGKDKSLHDFSNDLGVQNLALKYLQRTDPAAYADYHAERDGLMSRSRAYLRTMSGVTAFGGFSVLFVQQMIRVMGDKNPNELFNVMPYAGQFVFESGPLIGKSIDTLYTGIVLEPKKAQLAYRLVRGSESSDLSTAKEVFETLSKDGEASRFSDALFRNTAPGFIYHVYLCDRAEAGHLIDQTVSLPDRKRFAEGYLGINNGNAFLFADALTDEGTADNPKPIAEPLLSKDQRSSAQIVQMGEVQRETVAGYAGKWSNSNLTRLILANSEGSYAQMQLGNDVIRLIPSMATIFAYETYADACTQTASGDSNKKPVSKRKPGAQS